MTRVVVPLDMLLAPNVTADEPSDDHLDWCFDDPELTQQLRAAKSGRRIPIALIVGSTLAVVTALLLFA